MIGRLVSVAIVSATMVTAQPVRDNAKPETTGTAQISGTIQIAAETPTPARRATVMIAGELSGVRLAVVTDDHGAFAFTGLPADRYTVSATKGGLLPSMYGSKRPGGSGTPVVLAAAGRAAIAMTMLRGGVLSGTVRDEYGRPLPNVLVRAMRYAFSSSTGSQALQTVATGSSGYMPDGYSGESFPGSGVTDDRGEYRIWGLAAGQYIVSVEVRLPSIGPLDHGRSSDQRGRCAARATTAAQFSRRRAARIRPERHSHRHVARGLRARLLSSRDGIGRRDAHHAGAI
jgi:hypothetical protein